MFRPRVIPVLLLKNNVLVKSIKFKRHNYIGDPINAVRIFSDLKADELIILDIEATKQKRSISASLIQAIGEEANMPFGVGGGITTLQQIKEALKSGAEKVIVGAHAATNPTFIQRASETFGASTIAVCVDVKKNLLGKELVWIHNGKKSVSLDPAEFALQMQELGAGEIILQSISNDGMMMGYDLNLIKRVSAQLTIPVVALGGAGNNSHLKDAVTIAYANAVAAGSIFVYHGSNKGVLLNYPEHKLLNQVTWF